MKSKLSIRARHLHIGTNEARRSPTLIPLHLTHFIDSPCFSNEMLNISPSAEAHWQLLLWRWREWEHNVTVTHTHPPVSDHKLKYSCALTHTRTHTHLHLRWMKKTILLTFAFTVIRNPSLRKWRFNKIWISTWQLFCLILFVCLMKHQLSWFYLRFDLKMYPPGQVIVNKYIWKRCYSKVLFSIMLTLFCYCYKIFLSLYWRL